MIFKKIASIVLALVFTAIIIPCFTIKVAATNDTKAIIYDIDENTNDIITNVTIEKKGQFLLLHFFIIYNDNLCVFLRSHPVRGEWIEI